MSNLNTGGQIISFRFKHPATAEDFNTAFSGSIEHGIYEGGNISIDNNYIKLEPHVAVYRVTNPDISNIEAHSVRIQTTQDIFLSSDTNDSTYVICGKYEWLNQQNNFADYYIKPVNSSPLHFSEIIFGQIIVSGGMPTSVNTLGRTRGINRAFTGELDNLLTNDKSSLVNAINELYQQLHP